MRRAAKSVAIARASSSDGWPTRSSACAAIFVHAPSMSTRSRRCRTGSLQNHSRTAWIARATAAGSTPAGAARVQAASQQASTLPE
jgi:hypothetical protein